MSSSRVLENSDGSKLRSFPKIYHNTVQSPKKPRKPPGGHCIKWEKEVQTGKTRYLPVEEALSLSSGVKKYGSLLKITGSSRPVGANSLANVSRGNLNKHRAQVTNVSPEKSTMQHSVGAAGYLKPQSLRNTQATELTKKPVQLSKENLQLGAAMRRVQKFVAWNQSGQSRDNEETRSRNQPEVNCLFKGLSKEWESEGCGDSTIPERRSPNAVNASQMVIPHKTHPCDPALVPSWKGSFDIIGGIKPGMLYNLIQAHPPSRVKRKVYEFSGNMPDTLQFELFPRADIWTGLFHNHCPGKKDVGLYFFASEVERSEIFMDLVEFMRIQDLVMRTLINGVELLVLASTVLCSDSERWNSEYFLWGLFRRIRQDTTGCAEGGSSEVIDMEVDMLGREDVCTTYEVDMEIDMIAGENVGRVDIIVSTASRNRFGSSSKDTAVICDPFESVTPLASRGGKGLPKVVFKKEPFDTFPPGFSPRPN